MVIGPVEPIPPIAEGAVGKPFGGSGVRASGGTLWESECVMRPSIEALAEHSDPVILR